MPDFTLSRDFWADFAARHWEQAPLVIERPFDGPIMSLEEIFTASVAASDAFRESTLGRHVQPVPPVRLFIDKAEPRCDFYQYLPGDRDEGIAGYVARLEHQLDDRRFELIVPELQGRSYGLWSRMRSFLRGLYRHVGLPALRAEVVAFIRTQTCTSMGMHRDEGGAFMFVIEGRKRILAWPEAAMRGHERLLVTTDYEQLRDRAIVLQGEPGDVIYWPSTHWHVGESNGPSVSLNLTLGLWPPATDVLRQLSLLARHRVSKSLGPTWPIDPDDLQTSAAAVPAGLRGALRAAREIVMDEKLERYLEFNWLKRVTAAGFTHVPPLGAPRRLADSETVHVADDEPVVWIPLGEHGVAYSAAGHAFAATSSPQLSSMLGRLRAGARERVGALLDGVAPGQRPEQREALREVLDQLLRVRAIVAEA